MKKNIDNLKTNECIVVTSQNQLDKVLLFSQDIDFNWLRGETIEQPAFIFRFSDGVGIAYSFESLTMIEQPRIIYPAKDFYAKKFVERHKGQVFVGDASRLFARGHTF